MPYLKQAHRAQLDAAIDELYGLLETDPGKFAGELNYVIARLVQAPLLQKTSYAALSAIIGTLECAKLEIYRRLAAPYEDNKCKENGDVF